MLKSINTKEIKTHDSELIFDGGFNDLRVGHPVEIVLEGELSIVPGGVDFRVHLQKLRAGR